MSRVGRTYPPSEAYDERPRRRGGRDYQEVDVDVRESDYRRAPPDYLREDYGRAPNAGPMVIRERNDADYDRYERDRPRQSTRPRGDREDIDIDIRESDYSRGPPRSRRNGQEREEITIRRDDVDEAPPRSHRRDQSRNVVDVDIREQEGRAPPYPRSRSRAPPPEEDEEIDVKISRNEPTRSRPRDTRDTLAVRESSRTRRRSMPPPRNVAREREDFVYRRRSPSRPRETEEIVIRQTKSPSPSPPAAPSPPPPPPPPVETRPPIVQEVITHRRTIDHGVFQAPPSPESSPSPPPQRKKQDLEVDIRRTDSRGNTTEEDIRIRDNENNNRRDDRRDRELDRRVSRRRSMESVPAPAASRSNKEETNINVNIDTGGANSNPDRQLGPVRQKPREMWTEVTKDLVSREAIQVAGYQFEETEDFFYVMAYLRYEDVSQLVDITNDLRYGRRERIDQIQWERQDPRLHRDSRPRRGPPPPADRYDGWDEVTHDREVTYEDRSRRGYH